MRSILLVLAAILFTTGAALALDITAPGAVVPTGDTGIVQNDLVCVPNGAGISLQTGATLNLNGHVLDGCTVSASALPPKALRATVVGPGEIRNATSAIVISAGTLRVRNVVISDPVDYGILGSSGENGGPSTLKLSDVTVTGSAGYGIMGTKVKAKTVTSSGNASAGIVGWNGVVGSAVTASTNGGEGVFSAAGRTALTNSQVTGNTNSGVAGFNVTVSRSTVTGNGAGGGYDVVSSRPPHVHNSTCGTSRKADDTASWGVCAGD